MPHPHAHLLLCLSLATGLALTSLSPLPVTAAEEEFVLLTIEGDLIGPLDKQDGAPDPGALINAYYALLPLQQQSELQSLRRRLLALAPDYDVAFTAADSAELTEVKSRISECWAAMQRLHGQYFRSEVITLLDEAYAALLSLAGAPPLQTE